MTPAVLVVLKFLFFYEERYGYSGEKYVGREYSPWLSKLIFKKKRIPTAIGMNKPEKTKFVVLRSFSIKVQRDRKKFTVPYYE